MPHLPLASVAEFTEDDDNEENSNSSSGRDVSGGGSSSSLSLPTKGLKRSPYLSQMTQNADSDWIMKLSRPNADKGQLAGGDNSGDGRANVGGGGGDFFSLRRPQIKICDDGQLLLQKKRQQQPLRASFNAPLQQMPSALRGGSSSALRSAASASADVDASAEMKKNSSVTFSQSTKKGSSLGLQAAVVDAAAAAAVDGANLVPVNEQQQQSQPVQTDAAVTRPRSSSLNEQQRKNQFPFYFDTLSTMDMDTHSISPSPPTPLSSNNQVDNTCTTSNNNNKPPRQQHHGHHRTKSKSTNTLQYYYKPLLQNTDMMMSISPNNFSKSLHNLTFREMLDEGDGKEGDLNVRLRNEQWKVFRTNSACVSEDESGDTNEGNNDNNSHSLSGLKRTLTPTSSGGDTIDGKAADASPSHHVLRMMDHPHITTLPNQQRLIGSDRGCVSAHDLAVFRRSASRMKMASSGGGGIAGHAAMGMNTTSLQQHSQQRPGETLGASMLSRLSSMESQGNVVGSMRDVGSAVAVQPAASASVASASASNNNDVPFALTFANDTASSPLAQMMARKINTMANTNTTATASDMNRPQHTATMPFMGRRVHTVSAGLAYGSAGFHMDSNTRISRFDLLKSSGVSALSLSSGGSGAGGGKNEEWS